jgi:hypothetical protein
MIVFVKFCVKETSMGDPCNLYTCTNKNGGSVVFSRCLHWEFSGEIRKYQQNQIPFTSSGIKGAGDGGGGGEGWGPMQCEKQGSYVHLESSPWKMSAAEPLS